MSNPKDYQKDLFDAIMDDLDNDIDLTISDIESIHTLRHVFTALLDNLHKKGIITRKECYLICNKERTFEESPMSRHYDNEIKQRKETLK